MRAAVHLKPRLAKLMAWSLSKAGATARSWCSFPATSAGLLACLSRRKKQEVLQV